MLKQIGASGQLSMGKHLAGKYFQVEAQEGGVFMLRPMKVIPDADAWLHTPEMRTRLKKADAWMAKNPPATTDMKKFNAKIEAVLKAKAVKTR